MTDPLPLRVLVTGGAGFMGSDFLRFLLGGSEVEAVTGVRRPSPELVVNLDALTYAGNPDNLLGLDDHPRYRFVHGDVCDAATVGELMREVDTVVHFAAESHVDRSIESAAAFIRTNVEGTRVLLDAAREAGVARFHLVSTDEVYGHLPWRDPEAESTAHALARFRAGEPDAPPFFTEECPLAPRSPYSASKAAADHLALSYHHTHGLPVTITRASNNYGPRQFPEKLIPLMITNALEGDPLPVYGDGLHVRDWLHVRDHSRGVWAALTRGTAGRVYNLGGLAERTNLQVVRRILADVHASEDRIEFVTDRPGHDRRYGLDITRAEEELGWRPATPFEDGLSDTVSWYRESRRWWERVRSGDYRRGPEGA